MAALRDHRFREWQDRAAAATSFPTILAGRRKYFATLRRERVGFDAVPSDRWVDGWQDRGTQYSGRRQCLYVRIACCCGYDGSSFRPRVVSQMQDWAPIGRC